MGVRACMCVCAAVAVDCSHMNVSFQTFITVNEIILGSTTVTRVNNLRCLFPVQFHSRSTFCTRYTGVARPPGEWLRQLSDTIDSIEYTAR